MIYQHSEDIIDESTFFPELNGLLITSSHQIVNAIDKLRFTDLVSNVKNTDDPDRLKDLYFDFSLITTLLIKSFISTHQSIIQILSLGNKNEIIKDTTMSYGGDGMSLVREQIEKVFTLSLLCDDPIKWTEVYMKDEWKRAYEYKLHCKTENQNLPRFFNFYTNEFSNDFEKARNAFGISDLEKEYVEFKFYNPNTELPSHLISHAIIQFPTPGIVKQKITDINLKELLERWYWEYKYICGFNHAGFSKIRFSIMSDRRFSKYFDKSTTEDMYEDKIIFKSLWTSYAAFASASTEFLKFVSDDLEVKITLFNLWNKLQERSLIAKAVWNIRGKQFFPLI